ncbi:ATP synthase protein I [Aquimixticola soesokkakensis]|uniref:ATP synthase protein I n=1 Tax=Aquimixticola soesokkakensis TaxID=1519096 RepID=A0A1Y5SZS7_9RHOB|nr:AtpZ/AtpI family protein [Aquimixticola soesokkakensis]SLN52109.1 ATP synthase protein I [Aquimixticola soesokkakensis]
MTNPLDPERIRALEERIERAKAAQAPKPRADEHFSQANMAWRMVIELVAGLGIGLFIGLGLDKLFGTMPLFLVIFTGLGFVAGIKTMMRSAEEIQKENTATAHAPEADNDATKADKTAADERD